MFSGLPDILHMNQMFLPQAQDPVLILKTHLIIGLVTNYLCPAVSGCFGGFLLPKALTE